MKNMDIKKQAEQYAEKFRLVPETKGWYQQKVDDFTAGYEAALYQLKHHASGNDSIKNCQNCKFYSPDENRCNHEYWNICVIRGSDGYVKSYTYHDYR